MAALNTNYDLKINDLWISFMFNNLNSLTAENQVLNLKIPFGCPLHSAAPVSCTTQPSPATLLGKPYLNFVL
jgi:hypothetical protein